MYLPSPGSDFEDTLLLYRKKSSGDTNNVAVYNGAIIVLIYLAVAAFWTLCRKMNWCCFADSAQPTFVVRRLPVIMEEDEEEEKKEEEEERGEIGVDEIRVLTTEL